jgi:hypothetical protein
MEIDICAGKANHVLPHEGRRYMGDKSPKAKDKSRNQHTTDKNQKAAKAAAKAAPPAPGAGKKGR